MRQWKLFSAMCALAAPASADTNLWDGDTDGDWGTASNWAGDTAFTDGMDVEFYSTNALNLTTTLGANRVVNLLMFNSNATSTVSISGNTLYLLGGIQFDPLSTSHTITSTINISNFNQTWNLNSGQTLTVGVVNDGDNSIITVSNGTVLVTASGNVWQWNMVNGATLTMDAANRFGDTATTIALDGTSTFDAGGFTDAWRGLHGTGLVTNWGGGNMDLRPQVGERFVFSGTVQASNETQASWVMQGASTVGTQVFETTLPFYANLQILNGVGVLAGANGAAPNISSNINIGRADIDTPKFGTNAVLVLDSSGANHASSDRLNDSMQINLRAAAELALVGNNFSDTAEAVGALVVSAANEIRPHVVVTVDAGTGAGAQLTSSALNRTLGGGTILFRGDNLGQGTIGPGTSLITFTTVPTLSSTGALGSPQAGILPYALGDNSPSGDGTDFVTYGANGIRLLTAAEYTNAFGGGANVELTSSPSALSGNTADLALKISGGTPVDIDLGGNTLTLSAGAILSGGTGPLTNTIRNGTLTFGNNDATGYDGILHVQQDLDLSAQITDNGANAVSLIKSGAGTLYVNTNLTYSGRTVIDGGTVVVNGNNFLGTNQLSLDGTLALADGVSQEIGMLAGSGRAAIYIGTNQSLIIRGGVGDRSYYGIITGAASANIFKIGGNTQYIRKDNDTFLGDVFIQGGEWEMIEANARMRNATFYIENGGTLTLNNNNGTSQGNGDRLGSSKIINFNRGTFIATGLRNGRISENAGAFEFDGGYNVITLDAAGATTVTDPTHGDIYVAADNLVRRSRSTGLLRGDNLGQDLALTGSVGQSQFILDVMRGTNLLSNQSWTNKGPGSTDLPIVPWLTGGATAGDGGSTFITYQTNFGFRPLDEATEFVNQTFGPAGNIDAGTASNNNLRVAFTNNNMDATLTENLAVLGLLLDNTGGSGSDVQIGTNILTVESGLILSTGSADNQIVGGAGSGITFGTNDETGFEGRIHGVRRVDINAPITDNIIAGTTNAVSLTLDGTIVINTVATYSGDTVINSGLLQTGTGNDRLPTNTVVTVNGNGRLQLNTRDQTIGGLQGIGFVENENTSNPANDSILTIDVTNAAAIYTFSGTLRDRSVRTPTNAPLRLVKAGPGTQYLAGTNLYTGGTTVNGGALIAMHALSFPVFSNATDVAAGTPDYSMWQSVTANSNGTLAVRAGRANEWQAGEIDNFRTNANFNSGSYFGIDVDSGQTFTYGTDLSNSVAAPLWGFAKSDAGVLNLTGILDMPEDVEVRQGQLNLSGPLVRGDDLRVLDSGTVRFLGPLNLFSTASTTNGSTLIVSNTAGLTMFGVLTNRGTSTFEGETNLVGLIAGEAGTINLRGNYTGVSNVILNGGADINFGIGTDPDDFTQIAQDILVIHDGVNNSAVTFTGGTNEVFGSIRLLSATNVNPPSLSFLAPKTIVHGDVFIGPSDSNVFGAGSLLVGNSEGDSTEIYGNLIIDTPNKRSNTAQDIARGDLTVSSNIIINASGLDFRAFNNTNTTTFYGGPRLLIEADFDTNWTDGIGLNERLLSGTLANGPDGIVIRDFGSLDLNFVRTNTPAAVDYVVGQKITIDSTGPKYWYGPSGEGRTLEVVCDTNIVYGRAAAGDPTIHLTNIWMRDGSFMRVNVSGDTVRLGITVDGPTTNGVATLSDGTSGNNDAFDLLDVRSGTPGMAKILQIGATNGRLNPDGLTYSLDDIPFTNTLRGASSPDITLDIFNGQLTVDPTLGGDIQGGVIVRLNQALFINSGPDTILNLAGAGRVIGDVSVSNVLSPGDPGSAPGTLTITGDVRFFDTSIFEFDLRGDDMTVGGGINDLLSIDGAGSDLVLDGILNISGIGTFTNASLGDTWTLISYGGVLTSNGLELGSALPELAAGLAWGIDYDLINQQINLTVVIPEPTAWILILIGLGVFGLAARRRP
ncbi:MAG TPA: autotransporter-associated beta strand repeat-containing protein [Verrucomicrobiae bacterium]|nr:autotransporter-associated beta strand repeat-containing protein [Verrucomicrobiae bacterium]